VQTQLGVEVAIVKSPSKLYVAFRGTDGSNEDLLLDLNANLKPLEFPNDASVRGRVHDGFQESVFGEYGVYKVLDEALDSAIDLYPDYPIEFLGHSLGGAQSILYAAYVATELYPNKQFSTKSIGTPKIGDNDLKRWMEGIENLAIWRMVNRDGKLL